MKAKIALSLLAISTSLGAGEATTNNLKISYGMSTCRNKRDDQQDRFAHVSYDHGAFFSVYDGHCGAGVATFLKDNFHTFFAQSLVNKNKEDAFKDAFLKSEAYALKYYHDGSTALVAYIDQDTNKNSILHCAWVGDSRAVLECNGKLCCATKDHKPHRSDEKERIDKVGGRVDSQGYILRNVLNGRKWEVAGLAMSRSIGDRDMKTFGKGEIIATPEYVQIPLKSGHHFLIMASDGLWDVIDNEKAIEIVKEELGEERLEDDVDGGGLCNFVNNLLSATESQGKKFLIDIAEKLQDAAIQKNSSDNITVCVVKFDW